MNTEIDDTSDIATLFQRLLDNDYVDNEFVKAELNRIGISKAIGFVGPILTTDKSIKARSTAVSILGSTRDPAAIPLLIQALTQDDDGDVRMNAAWELGKMGQTEGITPLLIAALSTDKDSKVRQSAAIALGDLAAAHTSSALS